MPELEFFYSTRTPHQWSSGEQVRTLNDRGAPIADIQEAEALALAARRGTWGDESLVMTTFGFRCQTPVAEHPSI